MRTFTPAPWYDDGYRIYAPTNSDDKREGRVIVEYKHSDDFNHDDAALIAAAPEMLAMLEYLESWAAAVGQDHRPIWGDVKKLINEIRWSK